MQRAIRRSLLLIPTLSRPTTTRYCTFIRHMSSTANGTAAEPITARGLITLSDTEEQFVRLLDKFARGYETPIECRIAGGWVRDKILKLPSNDLDIALSTTSGYAFAKAFAEYLKTQGVATGSVGCVAANPEQSKHLETGTTTIMGLDCDFVGLRSETYTDSRIPEKVTLGTPLEDALRRDLTLNSMFFNVHSRQVEDWTRYGLADLEAKIARTPLPPRQTFLDDPLRVLRTVRFSSRFNLTIEPEVAAAIREPEIQHALRTKVSRERVGIETTKMMHNNPVQSLELIEGLHLHSSMFAAPVSAPFPHDQAVHAAHILSKVLERGAGPSSDNLWLAAAVCPYRGERIEVKKGKEESVVAVIMAESLKLSTEIKLGVSNLFEATPLLDPTLQGRARIGVVLQHPAVKPWEQSLVWAITERILAIWNGEWTDEHEKIFEQFMKFKAHIIELGLPEAIKQPPLLDGRELQQLLQIRPGAILAVLSREINAWQLDRPGATKDECTAWLLEQWNGPARAQWEAQVPPPPNKSGKARKQKEPKAGAAGKENKASTESAANSRKHT